MTGDQLQPDKNEKINSSYYMSDKEERAARIKRDPEKKRRGRLAGAADTSDLVYSCPFCLIFFLMILRACPYLK